MSIMHCFCVSPMPPLRSSSSHVILLAGSKFWGCEVWKKQNKLEPSIDESLLLSAGREGARVFCVSLPSHLCGAGEREQGAAYLHAFPIRARIWRWSTYLHIFCKYTVTEMRTPAYRLNFICQPTFTEVFVFRIDGRSKRRVYLHTFLRLPTFTGRSAKKAGIPSRRVAIISITVGIISMSMSVYLHKKRAY